MKQNQREVISKGRVRVKTGLLLKTWATFTKDQILNHFE